MYRKPHKSTYQQYDALLTKPVKGRRRIGTQNYTYVRRGEGDKIELFVDWGHRDDQHVLATITPDNVMTLRLGKNAGYIWATNRIYAASGVWVGSDRSHHRNHEQPVRVWSTLFERGKSLPYFDGMQINLNATKFNGNDLILNKDQAVDKVRRVDRAKAAEVRRHLAPLVKLFKVSVKIGALDDVIGTLGRNARYNAKPTHTLEELVNGAQDPDMAQVHALYMHGVKRTTISYWGDIREQLANVPENAVRALRQHAYKMNNLYSYVEKE